MGGLARRLANAAIAGGCLLAAVIGLIAWISLAYTAAQDPSNTAIVVVAVAGGLSGPGVFAMYFFSQRDRDGQLSSIWSSRAVRRVGLWGVVSFFLITALVVAAP